MQLISASSKAKYASLFKPASLMIQKNSLLCYKPNPRRYFNTDTNKRFKARPNSHLPSIIDLNLKYHEWLVKTLALRGTFNDPFVKSQYLHFSSDSSTHTQNYIARKAPPAASRVVVVGSGGLSIGQAGEFDYSGMFYLPDRRFIIR